MLTCKQCERKVPDSIIDKLEHMINYHPELFLTKVAQLPDLSRAIGQHLADLLKGSSHDIGNG